MRRSPSAHRGQTLLIVFGNLVIFLQFLDGIQAITPDMPNRDPGRFRVFVRDLHKLLAALFVKLGNPQPEHLPFGGRIQAQIGIDDRLFHRLDHRFVPYLHRKKPRLGHTDSRKLVERHVRAIGVNLHWLQHRAAARPVRNPPSSCLKAWVAPCIRRFNSLMSKSPVGMTHSPQKNSWPRPLTLCACPSFTNWSAGDDGATTGAA